MTDCPVPHAPHTAQTAQRHDAREAGKRSDCILLRCIDSDGDN